MNNSLTAKRARPADTLAYGAICLCAFFSVALLAVLLGYVLVRGIGVVNWQFLTTVTSVLKGTVGIAGNLLNTLLIVVLTMLIATPLGVGAAVYLNEYARPGKLVSAIEFATETLSGIPSIIFGLFGSMFFGETLGLGYSLLTGSLTLILMVLPLLTRNTQEALKTVPDSYRTGALGLGAGKWYMIRTVLLPSATPGILTGAILAIGRIVGESAALLFTAGSAKALPKTVLRWCCWCWCCASIWRRRSWPPNWTQQGENKMDTEIKICVRGLNLYYGSNHALKNINMDIPAGAVTAFIGPSGCGKSTFLKTLNRMNDLVPGVRIEGEVLLDGQEIYGPNVDTIALRQKVGMVFQQPNPFPMSIYDNVAYGPRVHGIRGKEKLDDIVEESLQGAAIWEEVKDRLKKSALGLSGGQQQRLCIARALAVQPEVLLMDEPTSALDPISTAKIEDLMESLKKKYTVVVVTHNMQQATRVSDYTAFFLLGDLIEFGETKQVFSYPRQKKTEDYITGRFG